MYEYFVDDPFECAMKQHMRDNLAGIEVKALFPQVLIGQEGVMHHSLWLPGLSTQGFSIVKTWTGRATQAANINGLHGARTAFDIIGSASPGEM